MDRKKAKATWGWGKATGKTKAKGKVAPAVVPEAPQEEVVKRRQGVDETHPIYKYLSWDGINPPLGVMGGRVRSKGYHREYDRRLHSGHTKDEVKIYAKEKGTECLTLWRTYFHVAAKT